MTVKIVFILLSALLGFFIGKFLISLILTLLGVSCWMLLYHFMFRGFTVVLERKKLMSFMKNIRRHKIERYFSEFFSVVWRLHIVV